MTINRRSFVTGSLTLAPTAPLLRAAPAFAAETRAVPQSLVHPELRALVPGVEQFAMMQTTLTRATLAAARAPNPLFNCKLSADVPFERRVIPVGKPHPDVAIYVINAKPGTSRPAILHTHGGLYAGDCRGVGL